ncbi:spore germination lipoprotein GerD [Geomicrobium sp. JCM 19055]|uniref:spore germination lipoprotein GerD n=1 Tax=Geomicrobium sp. JCM 19055 TaxID=1460649 RepID=UPI0006938546|nr:spore germination lipoprotein GerD [Geomicrobium sp. JCM 19055]
MSPFAQSKRKAKGGSVVAEALIYTHCLYDGTSSHRMRSLSRRSASDYDETKRMVADVIKTEEGKQALREVLTEEEFQTSLVMEQSFVQDTIHDTLTSEEGKAFWGQLIDDPKFGVKVADSMQTKNEEVLKRLMKDPDYQTMMMEVMHDPEMEQATLELMKSKEFREQIMTVIEESMQNPRFQASLQKNCK